MNNTNENSGLGSSEPDDIKKTIRASWSELWKQQGYSDAVIAVCLSTGFFS